MKDYVDVIFASVKLKPAVFIPGCAQVCVRVWCARTAHRTAMQLPPGLHQRLTIGLRTDATRTP